MKITAHILVKNEARFVWFSVMSVIEHVDKVLLWDTGSTDGTIEVIRQIKRLSNKKVEVKLLGNVTAEEFTDIRQQMLNETKTDWFILVDGDEIWWQDSIRHLVSVIKKEGSLESIVVPTINLVGDIYHYQEEAAGRYKLAGRKGHLNLRAINRKIPGLRSAKPHGTWGFVDENERMIQYRSKKKVVFVDSPYLHATFIQRAGLRQYDLSVPKRARKLKYELGISFPHDFYYPEVFFRPRSDIIPSPWGKVSMAYKIRSVFFKPARSFKRTFLPSKPGY